MKYKSILLTLIITSSTLAGCTGDPDAGGSDEINIETIQGLLDNSTLELITNITDDSSPIMYYANGEFGYFGDEYQYDLGVWTEVEDNHWTYVGTPANWIDVGTIHQNEGEMIELYYVGFIGKLNSSLGNYQSDTSYDVLRGFSDTTYGWEMNCSNGETSELNASQWSSWSGMPTADSNYVVNRVFPMPGVECDYTLNFKSQHEFYDVHWTIVYIVTEITEASGHGSP